MTTSHARQIVLAARPKGKPDLADVRLEETTIPTPASGQLLLGVQYHSLDPSMRGRIDDRQSYATPLQVGEVMTSTRAEQNFDEALTRIQGLVMVDFWAE